MSILLFVGSESVRNGRPNPTATYLSSLFLLKSYSSTSVCKASRCFSLGQFFRFKCFSCALDVHINNSNVGCDASVSSLSRLLVRIRLSILELCVRSSFSNGESCTYRSFSSGLSDTFRSFTKFFREIRCVSIGSFVTSSVVSWLLEHSNTAMLP